MKFCQCGSLLKKVVTDTLVYTCESCKKQYKHEPEDTLLFEEIKGVNVVNYQQLISNAQNDRLNPTKRSDCKTCKKEVWVNYMVLGTSMTVVYTCLVCNTQWIPS